MQKSGYLLAGFTAVALAAAELSGGAALAQESKSLGTSDYWTAWTSTDANGLICYISSTPQKMLPADRDHGDVNFLVIHRKGLGTRNEVQTIVGYDFKPGSTPQASVDGKSYPMVIEGSAAWLASPGDEDGFVQNMKAGRELVVTATSARGTDTTYTYSLSGVTAAMGKIDKACS